MLLARKCVIYDPDSETILKHMSYSAAKLWNVGNYEKRNYRLLGLEKFPDWYDQKKRLKSHFFYKNLPFISAPLPPLSAPSSCGNRSSSRPPCRTGG